MSRIERRVGELVEDEEMAEAVSTVRSVAEEDGGTVAWGDVSDDLSSGQWGRLIEEGVVVDAEDGEGFELADPEALEAALGEDEVETEVDTEIDVDLDEPDTDGWTQYDKAAAGLAVVVMTGYAFGPVRSAVEAVIGPVLGPLDAVLPFHGVLIVVGLVTATYSALLQALMIDPQVIGYYQKRMKAVQSRQKKAKEVGDEAAQEQLQEKQMEMMTDQIDMFKEQFRPTVWIMLFTIPAFLWLLDTINQGSPAGPEPQMVMPVVGAVEWTSGLLGPMQTWIVWYILCSIAFGQIIRKAIDVNLSPD